MARIDLVDLAHSYGGDTYALKPMTMTWRQGGAYALLGPSGCGKTTLLNIISGIVTPSHGKVLFDGKDITTATTRERNIAQVFQFPVIYDTMTVGENLAFPLKNRGLARDVIGKRVTEIAVVFKSAPHLPFEDTATEELGRNAIVIRVQPDDVPVQHFFKADRCAGRQGVRLGHDQHQPVAARRRQCPRLAAQPAGSRIRASASRRARLLPTRQRQKKLATR